MGELARQYQGLAGTYELGANVSVDIVFLLHGEEQFTRSTCIVPRSFEPKFSHSERILIPV